jgi:hypothetical protein
VVPRALQEQEQPVRPGGLAIWIEGEKGPVEGEEAEEAEEAGEAEEEKTEKRRSSDRNRTMCRAAVQYRSSTVASKGSKICTGGCL